MKIVFDYPPTLNHLYATVKGRRVASADGKAYKNTAGWQANAAGAKLLEGPVVVSLRVYRPRRSGDLDNTMKALLDSLRGICWKDDEQIIEIRAIRFEDPKNPRVEFDYWEAS